MLDCDFRNVEESRGRGNAGICSILPLRKRCPTGSGARGLLKRCKSVQETSLTEDKALDVCAGEGESTKLLLLLIVDDNRKSPLRNCHF